MMNSKLIAFIAGTVVGAASAITGLYITTKVLSANTETVDDVTEEDIEIVEDVENIVDEVIDEVVTEQ